MFWATVRVGTKLISWKIMVTPAAWAARGENSVIVVSPMVTVPADGACTPLRIFRMVDLPAPFSPSNAWISPGQITRSTSSSARTPPKRIETPVIRTASAPRVPLAT